MFSSNNSDASLREMDDLKAKYHEIFENITHFQLSISALAGNTLGLKRKIDELQNGFKELALPKIPWAVTAGKQSGRGPRMTGR